MSNKQDNFDFKLKNIMDEGFEMPSDKVWAGIEMKLDAAAPVAEAASAAGSSAEKVRSLWVRRLSIATAVAASLTLIYIFSGLFESDPIDDFSATFAEVQDDGNNAGASDDSSVSAFADSSVGSGSSVGASSSVSAASEPVRILENSSEKVTLSENKENEIIEEYPAEQKGVQDAQLEDKQEVVQDSYADASKKNDEVYDDLDKYNDLLAIAEPLKKSNSFKVDFALSGNILGSKSEVATVTKADYIRNYQADINLEEGIIENGESTYSLPLSLGISTKLHLNDNWAIGLGLNYTYLSRSFSGVYNELVEGKSIKVTHYDNITNTQNYIGLPINLYYNIINNNSFVFYTYLGATIETPLSNDFILRGASSAPSGVSPLASSTPSSGESLPRITKGPHDGLQFSVNFGLGLEFILSDLLSLYVDPSLRYYLDTPQLKSVRTERPLNIGAEVGLRFRLGR